MSRSHTPIPSSLVGRTFLLAVLMMPFLGEAQPNRWQDGSDLNIGRWAFPLVELPSGDLLAAGGVADGDNFEESVEVLDVDTLVWTLVTPMPTAHRGRSHGVRLPSGEILIAGDDSPATQASAYRYDETLDVWEITANDPTISRFLATLSLLPDGRVLHAGGYDGTSLGPTYDTADIYDPATDSWTATGVMAEVRKAHTATLLTTGPDAGKILVVGGAERSPNNQATTGCELFDPVSGTWAATGSLNESREAHTATLLASGEVLVTGGQFFIGETNRASAELYDPDTGSWSLVASMSTPRAAHTATLLPSGKILIAGGRAGAFGSSTVLASAEVYHPPTDSWSPVAAMAAARNGHNAAALPDGRVVVVGGFNDDGALASTEIFGPEGVFADGFESGNTSAWTEVVP